MRNTTITVVSDPDGTQGKEMLKTLGAFMPLIEAVSKALDSTIDDDDVILWSVRSYGSDLDVGGSASVRWMRQEPNIVNLSRLVCGSKDDSGDDSSFLLRAMWDEIEHDQTGAVYVRKGTIESVEEIAQQIASRFIDLGKV